MILVHSFYKKLVENWIYERIGFYLINIGIPLLFLSLIFSPIILQDRIMLTIVLLGFFFINNYLLNDLIKSRSLKLDYSNIFTLAFYLNNTKSNITDKIQEMKDYLNEFLAENEHKRFYITKIKLLTYVIIISVTTGFLSFINMFEFNAFQLVSVALMTIISGGVIVFIMSIKKPSLFCDLDDAQELNQLFSVESKKYLIDPIIKQKVDFYLQLHVQNNLKFIEFLEK